MNNLIASLKPQDFFNLKREIPSRFLIDIDEDMEKQEQRSSLDCDQIFRLLPQRRLVCRAKNSNYASAVLLKLFYHPQKAQHDYDLEIGGYDQFAQTSLLIPKRLAHGKWTSNAYYILYEYLEDAKNLSLVLKQTQNPSYLSQMLESIACMHQSGLQQLDLHLDNFLLQHEKLYSIDFAEVQTLKSTAEQNKNLADILSQLPIQEDKQLQQRLQQYNKNIPNAPLSLGKLQIEIKQWRDWRIKKYLQKAARSCSEFVKSQSFKEFTVLRREYNQPDWHDFFNHLDDLMQSAKRLKDGNTATVCLVEFKQQFFVVKRYNIKNFRHLLSRFWRPSRAWVSWQNAQRLAVLGIATPKPIAVIEKRFGWFRLQAFYISEYNSGIDALSFYRQNQHFSTAQLDSFKVLFDNLKNAQIAHGDMKANNLLMDTSANSTGISIIDLDAMQYLKNTTKFNQAHQRDIKRFLKNWQGDKDLLQQISPLVEAEH